MSRFAGRNRTCHFTNRQNKTLTEFLNPTPVGDDRDLDVAPLVVDAAVAGARIPTGTRQRERPDRGAEERQEHVRAEPHLEDPGDARRSGDRALVSYGLGWASVFSVLVVDDDPPIRRMLERTFAAEGYRVEAAADGGAALAAVERSVPDLLVLDVAMPGIDGLVVCRRLRSRGLAVPILLLTARDAVPDRVAGLDAGADDYLVKPFASEELLARARALLRRGSEPDELLAFDDLVLDVRTRSARRGEREIALSAREAEMLELLLRNPRQVISRALALERVWGGQSAATLNAVDRCVSYLRRKLGDPPLIQTVRGVGFRLQR